MQTAMMSAPSASTRPSASPCAASRLVIFSAVDRVWDTAQDPAGTRDAARWLASKDVPLVLVSHASAAAVRALQRQLGIRHPFVCAEGAALYVPAGYFPELTRIGRSEDGWHVVEFKGPQGSGAAVRLLASLYRLCADEVLLVGLGESLADRALLREVDVPVVVRQPAIDQAELLREVPSAYLTTGIGAAGWSETILGALPE